ncbi:MULTISPECIES: hypothetical protein [Pseudomonas]|uniref:Phage protein n=1 Tax=Pseudomonas luteola TaxID=47886 RepID=A0ABS0FPQ1_PSELU|nr:MULTISPECIES: hypothetical protein [Pseudomonas]MBF8642310.1 hypothetical protein [Pseudomonas zeshuii]RRW48310.1 hypothetical protein EGJ50_10130 [Pseudomonas luteola]SHJ23446.1 hypothetical protein SAMN05216295_109182 [Pseudomonas zeshuii]
MTIEQPKLPTLNQWFLSLEEGRQAVLREDKWMLAENAYQAGIEAERAARTAPAEQSEPVAEMKGSYLYPLKSIPSGTKLYTAPDALQAEVERLRKDRKACWEEFKALVKSSNDNERYLHEEIDRLNKEADENTAEWGAVRLELAEAKAERDAMKADAERYRWLRNNGETERGVMVLCVTGWEKPATAWATTCPDPETLDACIDDEIARTAKPEEGCPLCNGDCSAANPPVTNAH